MTPGALRKPHPTAPECVPEPPLRSRRHLLAVPPLTDPAEHIPDPSTRFLLGLAAQAYEVIEGSRSIAQLSATITVGVSRQLLAQRSALNERRAVYRDRRSKLVGAGRVRICRILPQVAEAAVVLHTEHRSHAVALRLEWVRSRWRACELLVL